MGARPNLSVSWAHQDGFLPKTAGFPGRLRSFPANSRFLAAKERWGRYLCDPCVPWRLKRVPCGGIGGASEFRVKARRGGETGVSSFRFQVSGWIPCHSWFPSASDQRPISGSQPWWVEPAERQLNPWCPLRCSLSMKRASVPALPSKPSQCSTAEIGGDAERDSRTPQTPAVHPSAMLPSGTSVRSGSSVGL